MSFYYSLFGLDSVCCFSPYGLRHLRQCGCFGVSRCISVLALVFYTRLQPNNDPICCGFVFHFQNSWHVFRISLIASPLTFIHCRLSAVDEHLCCVSTGINAVFIILNLIFVIVSMQHMVCWSLTMSVWQYTVIWIKTLVMENNVMCKLLWFTLQR